MNPLLCMFSTGPSKAWLTVSISLDFAIFTNPYPCAFIWNFWNSFSTSHSICRQISKCSKGQNIIQANTNRNIYMGWMEAFVPSMKNLLHVYRKRAFTLLNWVLKLLMKKCLIWFFSCLRPLFWPFYILPFCAVHLRTKGVRLLIYSLFAQIPFAFKMLFGR